MLCWAVQFRSVRHKGLKRLIEDDDGRSLDAQAVPKLRRMLATLAGIANPEQLAAFPLWRVHELGGDRRGTWTLSVTRNYRLTFALDEEGAIIDLDYEDHH